MKVIRAMICTAIFASGLPAMATAGEVLLKIGLAAPMTGPISHLGKDIQSGARLALDRINAQQPVIGGEKVRFEMVVEDDQSDPRVATQVANRLVDQKVVAVIGHYNSGTTIPASRIYAAAGIPQISPGSTSPVYTHQGLNTAFRNIANDDQQGSVLGNFAYDKLGARKVAVIDDRTAAGQGQADRFAKVFAQRGGRSSVASTPPTRHLILRQFSRKLRV